MTYATQQDLVDRFGELELIQLTDRADPPADAINATVVGKVLADADAEINGYLATRYTLPLAPVPTIIERLAADMARYYLYEDRVTEQVKERYDTAVKFLTAVSKGVVTLGVDAASAAPAESGGAQVAAGDRVFTVGKADGSQVGTLDDY